MMVSIQRFARIISNAAFLAATNLWQMMNKAQKKWNENKESCSTAESLPGWKDEGGKLRA